VTSPKKENMKNLLYGVVLISSLFVISKNSARADSPVSFRIAPLSYDFQVNAGDVKTGKLDVENVSDNDLQIAVEYSDFFIDDSGKYIFSDDREIENSEFKKYSMKSWITSGDENFQLKKRSSQTIEFKLSVPAEATLGGHYGAIFFRTVCPGMENKNVVASDKSSICVSGRIGTLFLVSVGGTPNRQGQIENVALSKFSSEDQTDLGVEIKNTGNTHFKPVGTVAVKNFLGQAVSKFEIGDKTLLPKNSYLYSSQIKRQDLIGFYTIDGQVRDGNGNLMQFKRYVFMPPWKETLITIFAVLGLIWFLKKFKIMKK